MFALNLAKTFIASNHPFMLGIKGNSYQRLLEGDANSGVAYRTRTIDGIFTTTTLKIRSSLDKLPPNSPPTLPTTTEKLAYFSGRTINSLFSVPFHTVRTIIDISLQILQIITYYPERGLEKLASKFSISYMPSYVLPRAIETIKKLSGCRDAINQLAERLFLINDNTKIKSLVEIML